ncbi:carboxylating nicotinate-nucleotide diphosphorylase [Desulfospira joergensenii]|uniref:carboxylating nicotinate-nucleotide diphosphorylase n=1 Tax=Desulfospira joergensenii TaxID=53329 RepID=UPI0003B68282|nr:carboxylating nicotinate-nucleotide diphosphorylase [Desulfospira joergensenii]
MNLTEQIISLALFEDSGLGDITSESILDSGHRGKGIMLAKESFVLAGIEVAKKVFYSLDPGIECRSGFTDGDRISEGEILFEARGRLIDLLKGERVALNFLQRLSGIATLTRTYVETLGSPPDNPGVRLVDTRKTTPGWRCLEKEAVRAGGGYNHRFSLFDGILIKDNHIAAAGSIEKAVRAVKSRTSHLMKIEVEVSSMDEVKEAVKSGADVIMLDNMSPPDMEQAVEYIKGRAIVEASGNVCLETLKRIASTGVDVISCGSLTHQARSVDISMRIS